MSAKPKILIFTDWFPPAYKAGGPITSLKHFEDHFYDKYDLYIFTSAYDIDLSMSIDNALVNKWSHYKGRSQVYYSDKNKQNYRSIKEIICSINPSHIYLNSLFSKSFTLFPLWAKKSTKAKYIIAPRGMLGKNSLKIKSFKKSIFLNIAKIMKLYADVIWQSTSTQEHKDILIQFPTGHIKSAPNLGKKAFDDLKLLKSKKSFHQQEIRLLYVGRISPIKNLKGLLKLLSTLDKDIQQNISLTIVGPPEDFQYYNACKLVSDKLSLHSINWLGAKSPDELENLYLNTHLYISSSYHENYGHSIAEALSYGTPVIVSENTPWKNLKSNKAGWNFTLSDKESFQKIITEITQMTEKKYFELVSSTLEYYSSIDQKTGAYNELFK